MQQSVISFKQEPVPISRNVRTRLIISRLDNLNSLLCGLQACQVDKMQFVQNAAAHTDSCQSEGSDHPSTVHSAALTAHRVPSAVQGAHTYIIRHWMVKGPRTSGICWSLIVRESHFGLHGVHMLLHVPRSRTRAGDRAFSSGSVHLVEWPFSGPTTSTALWYRQRTSEDIPVYRLVWFTMLLACDGSSL